MLFKGKFFTNHGRVAGHAQLKDTVSASGLRKTAEQIKSGHCNKTLILVTEETAANLAGKVPQKVHSSGISSNTTARVANKALGKMPSMGALGEAAPVVVVFAAACAVGIFISDLFD